MEMTELRKEKTMNFTCQINRGTNGQSRQWGNAGNTQISNSQETSQSQFSRRANDETIVREYLRSYGLNADDDGTYNTDWMEMSIDARPGDEEYRKAFYVSASSDGKWAKVIDKIPYGQRRDDGYVY
jgi:hypothetical protein